MQECGLGTDLGPVDVTLIPTTVSSHSKQSGTSLYAESKHRDSSDSGSESEGGGVAAASAAEIEHSISRIRLRYSRMREDFLTCSAKKMVKAFEESQCSVEDINTIMQERSRVKNLPMPKFNLKIPKFFSQKGVTLVLHGVWLHNRDGYLQYAIPTDQNNLPADFVEKTIEYFFL